MSRIHLAYMKAVLIFWQAWEYLLDGIDIVAGWIGRHPRKMLLLYVISLGVMWG